MGDTIWAGAKQLLRVDLSEKDFETWIAPLQYAGWFPATKDGFGNGLEDGLGELAVDAPNTFVRDWIRRHWQGALDAAVRTASGQPATVRLNVNPALQAVPAAPTADAPVAASSRPRRQASHGPLPRHSFDDFVVGASNQAAYRAMRAVAEGNTALNPLFIYGRTGLGKTHLLESVARALMLAGVGPVALVPAETFVNDMISAIKHHRMERFRGRYRALRTLIVDDVQFFCGKSHSQQEFKQTFNALYDGRRQIILASDRPPEELELEDSLRSRFGSGCLVDVQPPDPALRLELVHRKSEALQLLLPPDAITYIAAGFCENVRRLEGALQRVNAMCTLSGRDVSLALVIEALAPIAPKSMLAPTVDRIVDLICRERAIERADLVSPRRSQPISEARHLAMYLCRVCTQVPLERIGEAFGGRDHSTVLHGVRRVEKRMKTDDVFRQLVRKLEAYVEGASPGATSRPAARKASTSAVR
jgi:chromosomal replication initiator protein